MRALVCTKLGEPKFSNGSEEGALHVDDNFDPIPLPLRNNCVLIRVEAASLNFADALSIMGKYQERPKLPFIPGGEVSGTIISVSSNVKEFKEGDKVCAVVNTGGFAEEVACDANSVFHLPPGSNMAAASGLPVAFGTSHVALIYRAGLRAGQVLLVLGAGGGVGLAAVQIGKLCGAHVISVARGSKKAEALQRLGSDFVINTEENPDIKEAVLQHLKQSNLPKVDVLFDPVGGAQLDQSLKTLAWGAHIVIIGFASGKVPKIAANIALVKNWTIHGLYWGSYFKNQPWILKRSMKELLSWFADGSINVNVSHQFPLSEADKAFSALLRRDAIGKVVIRMDLEPSKSLSLRSRL